MDNIEFEFLLSARLRKIKKTLAAKADEYASGEDRLHNFKASADFQSETSPTTPVIEAWGMAKKHLISVQDMIFLQNEPKKELIDEKIGDAINYLILIEAILKEET